MHNTPHSVRLVRLAVRYPVRLQTRAIAGVCGMCGLNAPAHTRATTHHHRAHVSSHARKTYRTCRTYRTPHYLRGFAGHPIPHNKPHTSRTPFYLSISLKKGEVVEEKSRGVERCSEQNVARFNERMRAEAPEAFALAKALHQAGMLNGLNGASIGPVGSLPSGGAVPVLSVEAEKRIADHHWHSKRGGK